MDCKDRIAKILEEIHAEYRTISTCQMDLWRKIQTKENEKVTLYQGLHQHKEILEMIDSRLNVIGERLTEVVALLKTHEKHE